MVEMQRAAIIAAVLGLLAGCGKAPAADAARDRAVGEPLSFPDLQGRDGPASERGPDGRPDAPPPSDAHREAALSDGPRAEQRLDHKVTPDLHHDAWPGGPCFYDWSKWSCSGSAWSSTATCGGTTATITCILTSCTCKKASGTHNCATVGTTACAANQAAFKAGCCNF